MDCLKTISGTKCDRDKLIFLCRKRESIRLRQGIKIGPNTNYKKKDIFPIFQHFNVPNISLHYIIQC